MTQVQYYIKSRIIITLPADYVKSKDFLTDNEDLINTIKNIHNYKEDRPEICF